MIVASIGFLFDTYVLLMTPLVGVPAIAELLQVPANNPLVTEWTGRLLWLSALCGGIFGMLRGWLIDRFGRKRIMAAGIFVYSLSPAAAALSTSLAAFVFFRCTMFIGVCVEFVAAITWLAELFPEKRRKELVLGWTQAVASLGGLLVTGANALIIARAGQLPGLPLPDIFNPHASWRYLSLTGLLPAIPIALLLPFVPESQVWREKKLAGTLRRPSFAALFAPELRRVTLVTALLSACAYAAAFGALQLTPLRVAPGLAVWNWPNSARPSNPCRTKPASLTGSCPPLDASPTAQARWPARPTWRNWPPNEPASAPTCVPSEKSPAMPPSATTPKPPPRPAWPRSPRGSSELDTNLAQLTATQPAAKKALLDREKIMKQIGDNRDLQVGLSTPP